MLTVIARKNIIGIHDDEGLKALDGYMVFSYETDDADIIINEFEKRYPDFKADRYEIIAG